MINFVGDPFTKFYAKLKKVKKALARWSKETFGDVLKRVLDLEDQVYIKEGQLKMYPTPENREHLHRVSAELRKYSLFEKEFWRQKFRMRWFGEGDRNTKFFHSYVNGRRKKLNIAEIQTEQGDNITMGKNIGAEAGSYFETNLKKNG